MTHLSRSDWSECCEFFIALDFCECKLVTKMPRARSSSTKFGPRKKYSLARSALTATLTPAVGPAVGTQVNTVMVAAAAAQGKRKVKNFDINLALQQGNQVGTLIYYALVYVPNTSAPSVISTTSGTEFYAPASNVLCAGIYDADEGTGFRVRTRLARNLNAGDTIVLCTRASSSSASNISLNGVVSYVVSYN